MAHATHPDGLAPSSWRARHCRALPFLLGGAWAAFAALQLLAPAAVIPSALALFLVGIPHGSIERDPLAARMSTARRLPPSIAYTALYLVFGLLVFCSWLIEPWPTLVLALGLSAWHFSTGQDHEPRLIGVFVITASLLTYPVLTLDIFNALTGQTVDVQTAWLRTLGLLGIAAVWWPGGRHADLSVRLLWTGIFLTLHPVAAVACYFALSHSLGETAALLDQEDDGAARAVPRALARIYGPASLPALLGATAMIGGVLAGHVPLSVAAGLAIAFVVPHMLPVERLLRVERERG